MNFKLLLSICIMSINLYCRAQGFMYVNQSISEEKGINGFICPLLGPTTYENNLLNQFGTVKSTTDYNLTFLEPPIRQNSFLFSIPFEMEYTIRAQKTSIYLLNNQENLLQNEISQQLGIKQRLNANGIINIGFILYDLGTKTWSDPFDMNRINNSTSQNGIGFDASMCEINGTGLAIQYKFRTIELNNEKSGLQVDLTPEQLNLLDRNGLRHTLNVLYYYAINKHHIIEPLFHLSKQINQGKSVSNTSYKAGIAYTIKKNSFFMQASIYSLYFLYDEENPVFHTKQEDQAWEFMGLISFDNPWDLKFFGQQPFQFTFKTGYSFRESNIDYYSSSILSIQTGIFIFI